MNLFELFTAGLGVAFFVFLIFFLIYCNKYRKKVNEFNEACNGFKADLQMDCYDCKLKVAKRIKILFDGMEGVSPETKGAINELLDSFIDPTVPKYIYQCSGSESLKYIKTRMTKLLNRDCGVREKGYPVVEFVTYTERILGKMEMLRHVPIVTCSELHEKILKAKRLEWEMMIEIGRNKPEAIISLEEKSEKEASEQALPAGVNPDDLNKDVDENETEVPLDIKSEKKQDKAGGGGGGGGGDH